MEPYREDRPIIYIDKDKIKQNILETILSLPGARALKNFHDNPEGSALETLKLAAEDVIPFYGTYRNDGDISDYAKEAVMLGVPMPYIKHPTTGKPIPNNLKEALTPSSWANAKTGWKYNYPYARKLYTEEALPNSSVPREGLSTRGRINRTQIAVPGEEVIGPHQYTNTGSNIQNTGRQAMRTNTVPHNRNYTNITGERGWQGEMYPPGRRLRNDEFIGPQQWEDKYSRKLDAAIDENEYKWEYLINKTRPATSTRGRKAVVVPKQDIIDIALNQGRPDIAERVIRDDKSRISANSDPRMNSYLTTQNSVKLSNEEWKDIGNRQIEKELRETFASLPNDPDIRYRFAEYYGVPDLYQSWLNDPLPWEKMKDETTRKRSHRESSNRSRDKAFGRTIQR